MAESGSISVGTLSPVWTAGIQWPWVVVMALFIGGNFLLVSDQPYLGTGLLLGGLALAGFGLRAVVSGAPDALADGTRQLRRAVADAGDTAETSVYAVTARDGSILGTDVAKRYDVTAVSVGETGVTIHDDARVNLLNTNWSLGTSPETLSYAELDGVEYVEGTLRLRLADDTDRSFPADERPDDLLAAIERRLSPDEP
ncbi:hypothetical protein DVK02_09480 [Halobellus sp. Atlit-31R]|nr:hypothetical protein DVK02_09480 [Halobellus sp. Atlit-31R]